MEQIEGMSEILIPHQGYPAGINLIIYNDNVHSVNEVVVALMNSNYFSEVEAFQIAVITSQKGFMYLPFGKDRKAAEEIQNELKKYGLQSEIIFSEGLKKISVDRDTKTKKIN